MNLDYVSSALVANCMKGGSSLESAKEHAGTIATQGSEGDTLLVPCKNDICENQPWHDIENDWLRHIGIEKSKVENEKMNDVRFTVGQCKTCTYVLLFRGLQDGINTMGPIANASVIT